jgi:hypothetical protein
MYFYFGALMYFRSGVDRRPEWERFKAIFLKKNPLEEPLFKMDGLRMIRIKPQRVSCAKGLGDGFKAEF